MAMTVLYPPIVDTYMPAFLINKQNKTGTSRIYFALSKYNSLGSITDIKNDDKIYSVWVSLTNQYTNAPLLDTEIYKSGLKSVNVNQIGFDSTRNGDDKYFIDIPHTDLKTKQWEFRETYKVQLRFCKKIVSETIADDLHIINSVSGVTENLTAFSEWSTVCLLQGLIEKPVIKLNGFSSTDEVVFSSTDNQITGAINFDIEEDDYVNYYRLQLYNALDSTNVLYDSGNIYTHSQSYNEINYDLEYSFEDGVRYVLKISYTTNKLYEDFQNFKFLILDINTGFLDVDITTAAEDELGRIKVTVQSNNDMDTVFSNVAIRRTSNHSNFMVWEDVKVLPVLNEPIDLTWYDYTIESGVWYKYCVQKRDNFGHRGVAVIAEQPIMCLFHDMFLVGENQQLKIKFNPKINSFNNTLLESSTQTIGSQYPFIKRNGAVNYRQFSLSGLISHFMDEEEIFVKRDDLYEGSIELYEKYNKHNKITKYNDIILEKKFRDKVQEFLYDGKPKLFKSNTEGTILVRLMNTSFTPEPVLSNMLYTFNSTAYEIDKYSLANINKYNIQSIGTITPLKNMVDKQINIVSEDVENLKNTVADVNLLSLKDVIMTQETLTTADNSVFTIEYLTDIDINFTSEPYLVIVTENDIIKATKNTEYDNNNQLVKGYIINIDGINTLVSEKGHYSISNAKISDIQFIDLNDNFTASCNYTVTQEEKIDNIPMLMRYYQVTGYEDNVYWNTDDIIQDFIIPKYIGKYDKEYQKLYSIDDIVFEGEPNTVIYLQTAFDDNYYRTIINDTGYLNLTNTDYIFTGAYAAGIHLTQKTNDLPVLNSEFKIDESMLYTNVNDIIEPQKNTVYYVENLNNVQLYNNQQNMAYNNYIEEYKEWHNKRGNHYTVIYYNNNWYLFNKHDDVILPTYVFCMYNGEIEKGEFVK